jgi:hypothetical protein
MFVEKVPPYDLDTTCSPFQYWKSIMSDTPVAQVFVFFYISRSFSLNHFFFMQLAAILAALPSTQTMVERAFSSAGWQAVDREYLTSENLAQEVLQQLHSEFRHNLVLNRS